MNRKLYGERNEDKKRSVKERRQSEVEKKEKLRKWENL